MVGFGLPREAPVLLHFDGEFATAEDLTIASFTGRNFGWLLEDVRGVGLMLGVECPSGELAEEVQQAAFHRGLLVLEAGESAIRLSPPLVVTAEQCETALRLFGEAFEEVALSTPDAARGRGREEVVGG